MNTQLVAMVIAIVLGLGLVISIGAASLLVGALESLFGRPEFKFLKTSQGKRGFAFSFIWNEAKEEAKFDVIKLRIFNPKGNPTQVEVTKSFEPKSASFACDIDMGPSMDKFLQAQGFEQGLVQIELSSSGDGVGHQYEMKGKIFQQKIQHATDTVADYDKALAAAAGTATREEVVYGVVPRDTIATTVPGKGAQLALPTNPAFAAYFTQAGGATGGAGAAEAAVKENFALQKVWIIDGCIVCNACEDIYPEVFSVQADTCIVRPNPPLNDGLRVQDAAEACPVEVIKFTRAS